MTKCKVQKIEKGLYQSQYEHDACGVGMIANIHGNKSHQLVDDAVRFAQRVGAKQTYLIHSCHDIGLHEVVNQKLPSEIQMAYDGQTVVF